jgi:superfamily II DNA/RNA helicase
MVVLHIVPFPRRDFPSMRLLPSIPPSLPHSHTLTISTCMLVCAARPVALLLAPTRELAGQIAGEVASFTSAFRSSAVDVRVAHVRLGAVERLPHRAVCTLGGVPVADDIRALAAGVDVLVATPGRLLDLLQRGAVTLDRCCA